MVLELVRTSHFEIYLRIKCKKYLLRPLLKWPFFFPETLGRLNSKILNSMQVRQKKEFCGMICKSNELLPLKGVHMIRYKSSRQLSLDGFSFPLDGKLNWIIDG